MAPEARTRSIIVASWIGIVVNAVLAVAKVAIGLVDGSYSVISDGIDSGADILTSLLTLVTAHIMARPPDRRFPFGYSRADTLATKVLSFIIFFAGVELVIESISHLVENPPGNLPSAAAFLVTGISLAAKIGLAVYKVGLGRRLKSAMLVADGKNMQNDVVISIVVMVGLILVHVTGIGQIDAIAALLVSVWIIRTALVIFIESNAELMDGITDPKIYERVFGAVSCVYDASNPHRVRIRRLGHLYVVALDIEVDPSMTVAEAHEVAQRTEEIIKSQVGNIYDVVVHVEPAGNAEAGEGFGLDPSHYGGA